MSDREDYNKDPRVPCKYGLQCYQKNPAHHKKYKHPNKEKVKDETKTQHITKKLKIETASRDVKEVITKNDVSDSDDSESIPSSNIDKNKQITSTNNDVSDSDSTDKEDVGSKTDYVEDENKKTTELEIPDVLKTDSATNENKSNNEETKGETNYKDFIKEHFLVDMPEDFYKFWQFCKQIKKNNPLDALKDVGLILVGPYDVLAGKFDNVKKPHEQYLLHWRYYRDPPEFQTVIKGDERTGYHIGYFRDSPDELPVLLASNRAAKDGILALMGGNIFAAVNLYLDELKKCGDPFKKVYIGRIQSALKNEAMQIKMDMSHKTSNMVSREKKIVTRSFNKIGLVVPYDRRSQVGYRELALGNEELSTVLTKIQNSLPEQRTKYQSELQPVLTYASIAVDECDFGTGIELGWNIISHGIDCLNATALQFLVTTYPLLNREAFAKIAKVHMSNRKKGCNLSVI